MRQPQINQLNHSFFSMESGIEECGRPGKSGGTGSPPVGCSILSRRRIGRVDSIGRDADRLGEASRPDIIRFDRACGVPAASGHESSRMDEMLGQSFFPTMMMPGPMTHHAAGRYDEWDMV